MKTAIERIRAGAKKSARIQKDRKCQRTDAYEKDAKKCKCCNKDLPYHKRKNKYCSRSCSISTNNKGVRRHGKSPIAHPCKCCDKITTNKTFCSKDCQFNFVQRQVWESIRAGTWINNGATSKTLRKFLFADRGYKCEHCCQSKWLGEPILLTVHHLDGDATNNRLDNLKILCWNCHALTKNFGSKNLHSTRMYRYQT